MLGVLFTLGASTARYLPTVIWSQHTASSLLDALRSPVLGVYAACMALFHMSEYLTTAIYNPSEVKVGCKGTTQYSLSTLGA